jgi:formylmethanofuran dehydrogenase subunit E
MDRAEFMKLHFNVNVEDTVKCSRCEKPTPESELLEVGAWWVCGICYDDI